MIEVEHPIITKNTWVKVQFWISYFKLLPSALHTIVAIPL